MLGPAIFSIALFVLKSIKECCEAIHRVIHRKSKEKTTFACPFFLHTYFMGEKLRGPTLSLYTSREHQTTYCILLLSLDPWSPKRQEHDISPPFWWVIFPILSRDIPLYIYIYLYLYILFSFEIVEKQDWKKQSLLRAHYWEAAKPSDSSCIAALDYN